MPEAMGFGILPIEGANNSEDKHSTEEGNADGRSGKRPQTV